ncbi:SLOG family protein [Nocardiopsis terrae]|uniref:SLOG family protein n=1 Tax=Streptomyces sp. NPDC057554 TaxID=3350538 RepID=UPI0036B71F65
MSRRVIATGGRKYANRTKVAQALGEVGRRFGPGEHIVLVQGEGSGADRLAADEARRLGWTVESFPAWWEAPCRDTCRPGHRRMVRGRSICPAEGNYRNQRIADSRADLCLAFPGGRGTADMVRRATAAGIPVRHVTERGSSE